MKRVPFLLEIGTEEIPDWMIPPALAQMKSQDWLEGVLMREGIFCSQPRADGTPRRLVLRIDEVDDSKPQTTQPIRGPAKSAPFQAVEGFARKLGVTVSDLGTELTSKGEYYAYFRVTPGRPTKEILSEVLPGLIQKIYFPKTMYWKGEEVLGRAPRGFSGGTPMDPATEAAVHRRGAVNLYIFDAPQGPRWAQKPARFIRPIRWIVALLGNEVVPFKFEYVESGRLSRGHRRLGANDIEVSIDEYELQLRANYVILSADERRQKIEHGIAELGVAIKPDPALLETLVYLTEYPTPIAGSFDASFLELPEEVRTTVMRHHQKYFTAEGTQFVAVMNTDSDPDGLVRLGNERVLRARFNDARFFWETDQKKKLADRVEDLKHVTFQAKLGSYYQKTERVAALAQEIGGDEAARRAAWLSKADLTTELVKEFTELQGVVGGLYARVQGEPETVWRAIYEHYQPVGMEDAIPSTRAGQVVALADKLDTLRECFRIGMIPSGSKDPFALRRAAQGVVKILAEGEVAMALGNESPELNDFLADRVRFYFRDFRGFKYDEVNAAMAAGWSDLKDLAARLERLQKIRPTPDFEPLAASFKRIKNILRQAEYTGGAAFQAQLLEAGPEQELYEQTQRIAGQPIESVIASLRPTVDLFFDKVLVNAPDPQVRLNRLELLHRLLGEFKTFADFSEIVTSS